MAARHRRSTHTTAYSTYGSVAYAPAYDGKIGRASCRERVCQYV